MVLRVGLMQLAESTVVAVMKLQMQLTDIERKTPRRQRRIKVFRLMFSHTFTCNFLLVVLYVKFVIYAQLHGTPEVLDVMHRFYSTSFSEITKPYSVCNFVL